jgi:hypothetical protein
MSWSPALCRVVEDGELVAVRLGHEVIDDYLRFVGARCRPNTRLAAAYDLKVFFTVIGKEPVEVVTGGVFGFISEQRAPRRYSKVVRLEDGERGLSARTIKRRLATVSGLFAYLIARGDAGVTANPVPRGLATRWVKGPIRRGVPLLGAPRTLPRILSPAYRLDTRLSPPGQHLAGRRVCPRGVSVGVGDDVVRLGRRADRGGSGGRLRHRSARRRNALQRARAVLGGPDLLLPGWAASKGGWRCRSMSGSLRTSRCIGSSRGWQRHSGRRWTPTISRHAGCISAGCCPVTGRCPRRVR